MQFIWSAAKVEKLARRLTQKERELNHLRKQVIFTFNFKSSFLECPFRISFHFDSLKSKFIFNSVKSLHSHNHPEDSKSKYKLQEKEINEFIKDNVVEKNDGPAKIQEKLNLKFPNIQIHYDASANLLYKVKQEAFGEATMDAENLRELCAEISKKFPEFYYKLEINKDDRLSSIFIATPGMIKQYPKYKNLLIIDTTFGTNRFKLPLMLGTMINSLGKTVLAFFALVSSETIEHFQWVFSCFLECFGTPPDNVMTDECSSFAEAIKNKFNTSEHFICGFHKSNTIRRHLSKEGCYKHKASKNILFVLLIKC